LYKYVSQIVLFVNVGLNSHQNNVPPGWILWAFTYPWRSTSSEWQDGKDVSSKWKLRKVIYLQMLILSCYFCWTKCQMNHKRGNASSCAYFFLSKSSSNILLNSVVSSASYSLLDDWFLSYFMKQFQLQILYGA